ncbi:MAG: SDR family oxidoreductase [Flavobacteriales bacterium]|nr:SDR family oxidoreductase [Flavobacteriales bacterium]
MEKKRILVTGSNGLLGQKLIKQLRINENYELIATSRGANRISNKKGYLYASMDITNKEDIFRVFDEHKPDFVINTAAMTNVDACESNREECWLLNVTAVEYLVSASEKHDSHFIHLSTDFIFDGENGPYKETDKPNPLSYYGESKLAAEKIVQNSTTSWAIARTIIVYGIVEDMSRSNIVLWAKSALEKKERLTIVNDQFRSPTLAEDLADGCILIADKKAEGIYNLSGKDVMSIVELVRRVARYYQLDESYIEEISSTSLNQVAKRPAKTGFILDKAIAELGYEPYSFEEGIEELNKQLINSNS